MIFARSCSPLPTRGNPEALLPSLQTVYWLLPKLELIRMADDDTHITLKQLKAVLPDQNAWHVILRIDI
jgi:hypothetical protein